MVKQLKPGQLATIKVLGANCIVRCSKRVSYACKECKFAIYFHNCRINCLFDVESCKKQFGYNYYPIVIKTKRLW